MRTLTLTLALALALCATPFAQQMTGMQHAGMDMKAHPSPVTKAIAVLIPAGDNPVRGTVTFEKVDGGVRITAHITGLTPGKHGFHIHEFGDCSAPDFTSAGPHFMAAGEAHGSPSDPSAHQGDMGNLLADSSGVAHMEWTDPHMSFDGPTSILGRAVIVHEKEDDLTTQPTGNSGGRIACGVIGLAKS